MGSLSHLTVCGILPKHSKKCGVIRLRRIYGDRLFIQFAIVHRDLLAQHPERFYAEKEWRKPNRLAECVTPLVIEAGGTATPFGYGFGLEFALGCILDQRLRDLAPRWIDTTYGQFRELCGRVYAEACQPSDLPFLNWYELIGVRSLAQPSRKESDQRS
jgi:hypothetical protein